MLPRYWNRGRIAIAAAVQDSSELGPASGCPTQGIMLAAFCPVECLSCCVSLTAGLSCCGKPCDTRDINRLHLRALLAAAGPPPPAQPTLALATHAAALACVEAAMQLAHPCKAGGWEVACWAGWAPALMLDPGGADGGLKDRQRRWGAALTSGVIINPPSNTRTLND